MDDTGRPWPRTDGGRGFVIAKLISSLAAFELENCLPPPTPLDATAIAAATGNNLERATVVQAEPR